MNFRSVKFMSRRIQKTQCTQRYASATTARVNNLKLCESLAFSFPLLNTLTLTCGSVENAGRAERNLLYLFETVIDR